MRLVIFDVDGTLVDSQNFIVEAQARAFRSLGLEPATREAALSIVGLSLREAFLVLAGPDGPVDELAQAYRDCWSVMRHDPAWADPLYPGAYEAIETLRHRDDLILGIATGKSQKGVAHLVEKYDWQGVFSTVQTADDAPSKPAPAMLLQALAEVRVEASRAVMIGDTTYDMQMARSAGTDSIGVAWGYHTTESLVASGARRIVPDFKALLAALG